MVITMVAVRMVKAALDQIVDVVAMGDCLVAASWAMDVGRIVAAGRGGMSIRIGGADVDCVLLNRAVRSLMVEVAIVEIIDVAVVAYSGVATVRPVDVRMVGVRRGRAHADSFRCREDESIR